MKIPRRLTLQKFLPKNKPLLFAAVSADNIALTQISGIIIISLFIYLLSQQQTNRPKIETAQLENGLEIVVISDRRAPVITHMLWYRVGSGDEEKGKSGIAHFFEHLMFKGTPKIAGGEFSKIIARLGGQENAFTSHDFTAYYQRIPKEKLSTIMAMEADRMNNLILNEEDVNTERNVVLEERSLRIDAHPHAALGVLMRQKLYAGHPYAIPVIGWRKGLKNLKKSDLQAFYARHYTPDRAILVVAGDTNLAEISQLAKKYFTQAPSSRLQKTAKENRPQALSPPSQDPSMASLKEWSAPLIHADERTQQPIWQRLYRIAPWQKDTTPSHAALEVAIEILGGGEYARMYQTLGVQHGLATRASAWVDSLRIGYGEIGIFVAADKDNDFDRIAALITAQIEKLQTELVAKSELYRAKTQLVANALYSRDNQETMANIYGRAVSLNMDADTLTNWPHTLDQVSAQDVRLAAQYFFTPAQSITGHLISQKAK